MTTHQRTILIVDDDYSIKRLFHFILKNDYDGEFLFAANGKEAFELCQEHQPEMVLMDIVMPIMDGVTSMKKMRSSGYTNPIVAISSYANSEKKEFMASGANNVICKPASKEQILDQLKYIKGIS
ncbi:MAG: response regulator [Candidatus Marinimicrobia bacterium]|nr:response regulator [Candidatus Neomarinimicrobiota bacterium]